MNTNSKTIGTVLVFIVAALLIGYAFMRSGAAERKKQMDLDIQNTTVSAYAKTTSNRVGNSVVTLPEMTATTGLKDGHGTFVPPSTVAGEGTVSLSLGQLQTKFVPGVLDKKVPHLDAVVPMFVTGDRTGTSMFIVLFTDRGDTALEQSYARLGREDVIIQEIKILEPDPNTKQEYKVDIIYKKEGLDPKTKSFVSHPKETIIPVIDGHFDPAGTVNS